MIDGALWQHAVGHRSILRPWARLRFQPVMMTSFAFILGLVPLVTATGAAMLTRRADGGMLFASLLGIFFIPMLYVVFQWLRERVGSRRQTEAPSQSTPAK